jgi:pimeloyl-ACP methyl ester carboxylesterase
MDERAMDGIRHAVPSADGVVIGLMTAGSGPPLLVVHGGFGQIESWRSMWPQLTDLFRVTALDRRGRGSSGDDGPYSLNREYEDVGAVAEGLAAEHGGPVDVFAHSFGATCALGAAASGAPVRRLALYEPPGPPTAPLDWVERASTMVAEGNAGRAMVSFLTEILGLSADQIEELRSAPMTYDILAVVAATLPREARALTTVDLAAQARLVHCPVRLLLGTESPAWARDITASLAAILPSATVVDLPGLGHDAIDAAPGLLAQELVRFFDDAGTP